MRIEDRTRFEVLLEDIQTGVRLIPEGHLALNHRLEQMEARFEARLDGLEEEWLTCTILDPPAWGGAELADSHLRIRCIALGSQGGGRCAWLGSIR